MSESDRFEAWTRHAGWWQREHTGGVDPEYTEQMLPLAAEHLRGATRVLDVGTGEGQVARVATGVGAAVVGLDPVDEQLQTAVARGGGPRYVLGAAEALPFAAGAFDAVVACLVFEHVPDHRPAIAEVARVLEAGGRFVLLLNHPLLQVPDSGWVVDHVLEEEYWRVGPYLVESIESEELEAGVVLPFVHRPLSRYVNTMAEHGLLVEHMDEPAPPPGFLALAPEYAATAAIPRLLLMVAAKHG